MEVYDIIFCQKAFNDQNGSVTAQTILSAITPEYIPGLYTFSVIITILDLDDERKHTLTIMLKGPDNRIALRADKLDIPSIDNLATNLPKEYLGFNLAMDFNNVDFKIGGLYTLEVYIDEQLKKQKSIFVRGKNEQF